MSASVTDHHELDAFRTQDAEDEAPLRAAAGIGLAVLLSVPLWSGLMLAAWAWLA